MSTQQDLTARITANPLEVVGAIDRNIYGTLIEPIGRCVYGGLWAEMITNRKFWCKPADAASGLPAGWQPYGDSDGVSYSLDMEDYYSAPFSLKVSSSASDDEPRGIRQAGLWLAADKIYECSLYLRVEEAPKEIRVAFLRGEHVLASRLLKQPTAEWRGYRWRFGPLPEGNVDLATYMLGTGTVAFDSVSLMPEDNVRGLRWDVLETIKRLKPRVIRFPGGCFSDNYHWGDGIGDRDRRPARWNRAYGVIEDNDFGTDEFMFLCEEVGCQAYINTNFGSGMPEEAASWVRYCNEPADGPYGSQRKANGHAEPYNVLIWGVGNEIYGTWETGHTDATSYANRFCQFHEAMKSADPRIKMVAAGCDPHPFYDPVWNVVLLERAAERMDYLSVHKYVPGSGNKDLSRYDEQALYHVIVAAPLAVEKMLRDIDRTIALIAETEARPRLNFDEWNIWVRYNLEQGVDEEFQLRDALYAAGVFNVLQRLSNRVTMAIQSLLVNVLGAIMTSPADCYITSVGKAFELYSNHSGDVTVFSRVLECPTFEVWHMDEMPWMPKVPYLDCSATLSADGHRLFVAIVNRHPSLPITCELTFQKCFLLPRARLWELNASKVSTMNSLENKEAVSIHEGSFDGVKETFNYIFPKHSVTVLQCELA